MHWRHGLRALRWCLALGAAAAVAQGPGIMVGDRFIPKERMLVFLLMGNSALSGRDPARDQSALANAWNYVIKDPIREHPGVTPNIWVQARPPLHVDSRNGGFADPGTDFIRSLALASAPQGFHIAAMQISESALTAQHFQRGDLHYDALMNEAIKLKANVTFAGIIIMVGLVEGQQGGGYIANYLSNLKTTVAQVREDLGIPNLPYLHSRYPVNAKGEFDTALATVRQLRALEPQIPGLIANAALIPTHGLTIFTDLNLSHYDSAACKAWGRRTADTVLARGWATGITGIRPFLLARPGRKAPAGSWHMLSGRRIPYPGATVDRPGAGLYLWRQP